MSQSFCLPLSLSLSLNGSYAELDSVGNTFMFRENGQSHGKDHVAFRVLLSGRCWGLKVNLAFGDPNQVGLSRPPATRL